MSTKRLNILHLEDNAYDAELLQSMLETDGIECTIQRVDNRDDFVRALETHSFDLILSDFSLPVFDGLSGLNIAHEKAPQTPYIFVSGAIGEERAIDSLKRGATDYILKDNLARFVPAVRRAIAESDEKMLRQNAEEDAIRKDRRFRSIVETTQEWIWEMNLEGALTYSNPAAESILGIPPKSLLGTRRADLVHEDDRAAALEQFQSSRATKNGWSALTFRMIKGDKTFCWVESNAVPIKDDAGNLTGFIGSDRDITGRIESEQTIRDQARLLDVDPDAIIVEGLLGEVLFWSKGAERMLGWTSGETLGRSMNSVMPEESILPRTEARHTLLKEGHWKGEFALVTKNGKRIIAESHWTLVKDHDEKPKAVYTVTTDITERKRIEAQLYRVQRLESIGTLAGGIAHDLNNVLSPILLGAQSLKKQLTEESALRYVHAIEASAKRGAGMVKQVLSFARGAQLEKSIASVTGVIEEMKKIITQTFPKSIEISLSLSDPWPIFADSTQIHQVLLNLCVNARDAMPTGGRLMISVENVIVADEETLGLGGAKEGKYVLLKVSDTGTGIPSEIQDKIFDPFFTSKEVGKGTGLGLSTVLSIVRNHGGFVTLDSQAGKGATFNVYLPAHLPIADSRDESARRLMGENELILVADGEASFRDSARETLESNGYRAISVVDGAEMLVHYIGRKDEVAVVITDMSMPLMDGSATIRALRKVNPIVKIIATGKAQGEGDFDIAKTHGVSFLRKPYTDEQLLRTLKDVITR